MMDASSFTPYLFTVTLVMARMGAILMVLPLLSDQILSGVAMNVIRFGLALILFPLVLAQAPADMTISATMLILFKEVFLGILIGFLGGIPFWIASAVGFFVDNQRGASMAENFDPLIGAQNSPLGVFLTQFVMVLFFITGAYYSFFGLVYHSYTLWPVYSYLPTINFKLGLYFLNAMDYMMRESVLMAAPLLILLFLMDFGLGLVNRFAQQLNVFSLGAPVKSAMAIFVFVVYLVNLATLFKDSFFESNQLIQFLDKILKS